jgi:hypothetical protein
MNPSDVLKPSIPGYIPKAEDAQLGWLDNYEVKLPELAPKYGIADTEVQLALAAVRGMKTSLLLIREVRTWLEQWINVKNDQQNDKVKDQSVVVTWPATPAWSTFPEPIKVNAWAPVLSLEHPCYLHEKRTGNRHLVACSFHRVAPDRTGHRGSEKICRPRCRRDEWGFTELTFDFWHNWNFKASGRLPGAFLFFQMLSNDFAKGMADGGPYRFSTERFITH